VEGQLVKRKICNIAVIISQILLAGCASSSPAPNNAALSKPPNPNVTGVEYFVSPSGQDSNSGFAGSPWRTIQNAANHVASGVTIHIAPGSYAESVNITYGGTSSAHARFISDQRWGALVTGDGTQTDSFMVRSDYVDIVGFEVTSQAGNQGIELFGSYGSALGNHVHNVWAGACATDLGGAGIASSYSPPWANGYSSFPIGTGNVISGNIVHDIGDPTKGCGLIHGIYIMNHLNTVTNNVVFKTMGWGVTSWHYADQDIISNNTIFNNNTGGINTGASDGGSVDQDSTVINNLVFYNGIPTNGFVTLSEPGPRYGIGQEGSYGSNNVFANNIVFGNQPGDYRNNVSATGSQIVDPALGKVFVNWQLDGSGNYNLVTGSVAKGSGTFTCASGTAVCTPSMDIEGTMRSLISIDVGAFSQNSTLATWPWF
jgi:Protein of unknown function (DUF1565)